MNHRESPETIKYLVKTILTSANRNAWENVTYEAPAINTGIQILGTTVHRAPIRKEQIKLSNKNYTPTNIITFKKALVKKLNRTATITMIIQNVSINTHS